MESDRDAAPVTDTIDPYVQNAVAGTCGILYLPLMNRLSRYPIPHFRLPSVEGRSLIDIGCNWGRWSIAAAQKGYSVIGLDPNLDAIRAAARVCRQIGVTASFVVGDARHLPFKSGSVDTAFSYSVLQHFSKDDARQALREIARTLRPAGTSFVQMPNMFGLRSIYHQIRRSLAQRQSEDIFDVRYWRPHELQTLFSESIGPTSPSVDGFFGLGIQAADADLLPFKYRIVVRASEFLRRISGRVPMIMQFADSLYLQSVRNPLES